MESRNDLMAGRLSVGAGTLPYLVPNMRQDSEQEGNQNEGIPAITGIRLVLQSKVTKHRLRTQAIATGPQLLKERADIRRLSPVAQMTLVVAHRFRQTAVL